MANSYVTVEFIAVPVENDYLGINESVTGIGLNEIFKAVRTAAAESQLPSFSSDVPKYKITFSGTADYTDYGAVYSPVGGTMTQVPFLAMDMIDNIDGTYTIEVCSTSPVVVYQVSTGMSVLWPEGEFIVIGVCGAYINTVSQHYKTALDADYNIGGLFTITNIDGELESGLGTVTIAANFANAVFSLPESFPFARVTIYNFTVAPENSVSPTSLIFDVEPNVVAPSQSLSIVAELETWEIAGTLPDWLSVSALSGTGNATLTFTPIDYNDLLETSYDYILVVIVGSVEFEIMMTLNILRNIQNPFKAGNLYFTKGLDYIKFSTDFSNSYIELLLMITAFNYQSNTQKVYEKTFKIPYFQGKADFHVGSVVDSFFDPIKELQNIVSSYNSNYVSKQYRSTEVIISFQEKSYSTTEVLSSGTFPMFKMAKGYKPFTTQNQLTLLTVAQQEVIRITPDSPIATSFVFFGTPRLVVKKNNVIVEDFEVAPVLNKVIYTYFRFINDLKVGDSIELCIVNALETRTQRFFVMPKGKASTFFIFENQNQMLEPFEFTGRRRISSNLTFVNQTKVKNLYSVKKKAFSTNVQPMIVNTGQLTKTEHRIVTEICNSTNVWCSLNDAAGPYFQVDATTTKIPNEDTDSSDESLDVEFNILENANANIYPQ